MKALPKIIFTDIDGVWTDGGMYYSDDGSEFKKFNTSDSVGVLICKYLNVEIVILTGENSNLVSKRAKKLKIEEVYLGVKNKLKLAKDICDQKKINLSETSFIGDDINDYRLLNHVGYSGCPSSASSFIKKNCDYVTRRNGGEGCFREFVEEIVSNFHDLEKLTLKIIDENYKN